MRKLSLAALGMYFGILAAFSQSTQKRDSVYRIRKLKFEEANIVSSYYKQDGNNATVTGGIGSQELMDISTALDLKLVKYDKRDRKHSISLELGIDHYTSASSDKIDPSATSTASYDDNRIYPSVTWTMENAKGSTFGAGLYYSNEYDYESFGASINFAKKTKSRNGELSAKLQLYNDHIGAVYPIELRSSLAGTNPDMSRNTYSGTVSWSQIINTNLQLMAEAEVVYQEGWLGLPFHRVYFKDSSVDIEQLPSSRLKVPIGLRANYFLGDKIILRGWYRHYEDDWNITSNTFQLETSIKINPFISVTPFYRFYHQMAADYFAPYAEHALTDMYYTSNYDLSNFSSQFFGAGFRLAPPGGVLSIQHLNAVEIRFGHYLKNIEFNANIISLHIKFK